MKREGVGNHSVWLVQEGDSMDAVATSPLASTKSPAFFVAKG